MVVNGLDYFLKKYENGGKNLQGKCCCVKNIGVSMSSVQRIVKRKDEPLMTRGKNILRESLDLGS